jgi:quinol-cytochrome oxidoreductase complex cytochrome b subunit
MGWQLMKQLSSRRLLDKVNFVFAIIVVVIYLVVMPFMFRHEYKTNEKFRDLIACEYDITQSLSEICPIQAALEKTISKANLLTTIVILFWAGVIFEQDIWPNRKKIQEYFEKLED